jgi:hypothetical protein
MDLMLHVNIILYCKVICQCEKNEFILCSIVYEPLSHLRDGGGCTLVGRNTLLKKKIFCIENYTPYTGIKYFQLYTTFARRKS